MTLDQQQGKYRPLMMQAAGPFQVDRRMRVLPPPAPGAFAAPTDPARQRKRVPTMAARKSTGGMAPRKQLAPSPANALNPAKALALPDEEAELDDNNATSDLMEAQIEQDLSTLPDTDKMHRIIDLQQFGGSWLISAALLKMIGVTVEQVNNHMETHAHAHAHSDSNADADADADAAKATALAVSWLKTRVPNEEDVWDMVVEKAMAWLEGKLGRDGAKKIIDDAAKMV